ncbi:MAG: restriction endonuclease [Chloroflexi bacterium]|nr:restriction endonuclease [Chloroflexota bacterium]
MDKHNPEQFEIVSFRKGDDGKDLSVNGKYTYMRIVIRNKRLQT